MLNGFKILPIQVEESNSALIIHVNKSQAFYKLTTNTSFLTHIMPFQLEDWNFI